MTFTAAPLAWVKKLRLAPSNLTNLSELTVQLLLRLQASAHLFCFTGFLAAGGGNMTLGELEREFGPVNSQVALKPQHGSHEGKFGQLVDLTTLNN